jgi:serpin B
MRVRSILVGVSLSAACALVLGAVPMNVRAAEQQRARVKVTEDVRSIADSSNHFALDLYGRLREGPGNLFFSPASLSTALAMTSGGAAGRTQQEMAGVLRLRLQDERLHEAFGALGRMLDGSGKGYQLSMANRLWGQKTYPFHPEYLELTRERYGAPLSQLDFAKAEQARQSINEWVSEQTKGRIEDLIPPGLLNEMTRLVLTNAIYFKGAWQDEFSKRATQDAAFHLTGDRQIMAPTMRQMDDFPYGEADDLQVLELPYEGRDLSMVILLPKEIDGLATLEESLRPENLKAWTGRLGRREVRVFLPKFKLTSQFNLAATLRGMGMTLAFTPQADFSRMASIEDLMLSEVVHKAFVDVNEEGTEAAAATGVAVAAAAAPAGDPEEPIVFRADHPFVFLIRDNRSGAILFLGRVTDPRGDRS